MKTAKEALKEQRKVVAALHRREAEIAKQAQAEKDARIAKLLKSEVPLQMRMWQDEIDKQIQKGERMAHRSMPAGDVGDSVAEIVAVQLKDLGYYCTYSFSPGEAGRAAYDEMDTPDSYEMDVWW